MRSRSRQPDRVGSPTGRAATARSELERRTCWLATPPFSAGMSRVKDTAITLRPAPSASRPPPRCAIRAASATPRGGPLGRAGGMLATVSCALAVPRRHGVIQEAREQLKAQGVSTSHLHIKWIVPFHADEIAEILNGAKRVIVVENNYSGQFYRYMRSETGFTAHGHIRKYDGEPFMPHHIAEGIQELLAEKTDIYVPFQEITP